STGSTSSCPWRSAACGWASSRASCASAPSFRSALPVSRRRSAMNDRRDHGTGTPRGPEDPHGPGALGGRHGLHAAPHPTDSELTARGIVGLGIGLAILTPAVLGAVWLLSVGLKPVSVRHDPERSPLAEANARRQPPEPRLQTAPNDDIRTLRAQEDQVLNEYGPADRATGTARIPIERAIEILVQTGLPEPPQPPASLAAPGGAGARAHPPARAPAAAPRGRDRKAAR